MLRMPGAVSLAHATVIRRGLHPQCESRRMQSLTSCVANREAYTLAPNTCLLLPGASGVPPPLPPSLAPPSRTNEPNKVNAREISKTPNCPCTVHSLRRSARKKTGAPQRHTRYSSNAIRGPQLHLSLVVRPNSIDRA